jgi:hypothetical protein
LRTYERLNGKPAQRQITPSTASFRALKSPVNTLCKQAAGAPPEALIARLTPLLRGWANSHRSIICRKTFAQLDSFVWRRRFRWATLRHPHKTGRWIAARDFPHRAGEAWRFTDPVTGKHLIRVREAVKPQRHIKVKGEANPFAREWEAYFQHRDRQLAQQASVALRANILRQQHGQCAVCRQVIPSEETLDLHHRDGNHQNHRLTNLVRTRLQGEWRSVGRFSVKPSEVRLTTLEEAGNGINQDVKGRLAHLATGLTKRQTALDPAIALLTVSAMRGLAPQDATSPGAVKLSERVTPPAGLQNRACHFRGIRLLS